MSVAAKQSSNQQFIKTFEILEFCLGCDDWFFNSKKKVVQKRDVYHRAWCHLFLFLLAMMTIQLLIWFLSIYDLQLLWIYSKMKKE